MPVLIRKLSTIHTRYLSLLARNERVMQEILQRWFANAIKQIQTDLRTKFQKDVTTELTNWEFIEADGIKSIKPATLKIMQTGGQAAYNVLAVRGAFDVVNVRSIKAADKFTAKLVKDVTKETKAGIRGYIRDGIKTGKSMDKIARELRPLVGLTERQTKSISTSRKLLQEKRPDLSVAQVDKKVNAYANKTHRRRTQTIARTETANAQNIGYTQGMEELGVMEVEFSATIGACPICVRMDGKKYPTNEAAGIITVHPNCRCAMLPVIDAKTVKEPLKQAPEFSEELIQAPEDFPSWKNYLAEHEGDHPTGSAVLYDYYKLKYQATDKISPSALKHLKVSAHNYEAASIKINKPIPGLPSAKPVVKPAAVKPKPTEVSMEILPKSYFKEVEGWNKRHAAHKKDLMERMGFDPKDLNLRQMDTSEVKTALAKFETTLKSYTKPTIKTEQISGKSFDVVLTPNITKQKYVKARFESYHKDYLNKLDEVGCDGVIKLYNTKSTDTYVYAKSLRANAKVRDMAVHFSQTDAKHSAFHEFGHLIESNHAPRAKAFQWVKMRGKGKSMKFSDISSSYSDTEDAFKDKFIDPYVGKYYSDAATEVMSMGMQQFTSYEKMMRFAKKDFDHFSFIHGILTGAI